MNQIHIHVVSVVTVETIIYGIIINNIHVQMSENRTCARAGTIGREEQNRDISRFQKYEILIPTLKQGVTS